MIVLNVEEMALTSLLMCLGQILELEGVFVLEIVIFVLVVSEIAVLDTGGPLIGRPLIGRNSL